MSALLRMLSWRHLVLEPLRSLLLVSGIALGVAVFVGVQALNETTIASFEVLFRAGAGSADAIIEGGRAGLPASALASIRARPEVLAAAPIFSIYAIPAKDQNPGLEGRRLLVLGLDLLDPRSQEVYGISQPGDSANLDFDPSALLLNPRAALPSRELLQRTGLARGDSLRLVSARGELVLQIAGKLPDNGLSSSLGGDVLLMNLPAAQISFGRPGRVDRFACKLSDSADLQALEVELRKVLGDGVSLRRSDNQSGRASQMLGSMQVGLSLASLLTLLIGAFLIYNTMAMAVVRRRPELGMLRAVGATRAQLATLWIAEAAAYGVLGSILGAALGLAVAKLSLGFFADNVSKLYEAIDLKVLRWSWRTVITGLCAGPFVTITAAVLPLVEALKIAPVEAARRDLPPLDPDRQVRRLAIIGVVILLLTQGLILWVLTGVSLVGGAILQFLLTLGFALCAPFGVVFCTRRARPVLSWLFGPAGALAGDNLMKSPLRSGVTVASLMVALGGVLSIAALVVSLEACVSVWLEGVLTGDLYISASAPLGSQASTPLDREFEDVLRSYPEVEEVQALRFTFEDVGERVAMMIAVYMQPFGERSRIPVVAGSIEGARPELISGEGLMVSANFCALRGLKLGDTVEMQTPKGKVAFKIAIVVVDYSSEHGTVFIDRKRYDELFEDRRVNTFNMSMRAEVSAERRAAIADELRKKYGASHDLFVLDQRAFRAEILDTIRSSFTTSYAMEVVALGIALLGVVNTLFAAVLERTREIGVLRAIGASRPQIRRAVVAEALLLGALAGGFGVVCGLVLGYVMVTDITAGSFGWQIPFEPPIWPAITGAILAALLSALAGLVPGEQAGRINIVEALSYE